MSRSYVLGINKYAHSTSCAMLDMDGEVVFALSKERLTRKKFDGGDASAVLRHCLTRFGISLDEIALVVENCHLFRIDEFETRLNFAVGQYYYPSTYLDPLNMVAGSCTIPKLELSHHLAHAYGAIFASPFDRGVVVVMDGMGSLRADMMGEGANYLSEAQLPDGPDGYVEVPARFPERTQWREAETAYSFAGKDLHRLFKRWTALRSPALLHNYGFENMESLGAVYSRVSSQVFKDWNACGKVMGLAGYGSAERCDRIMKGPIEDLWVNWPFLDSLNPTDAWNHPGDEQLNADLAATIQDNLETIVLDFLRRLHARTGERNLILTGGVALNSQLNALIVAETPFENVYVPSAPGDNGVALGCAARGVAYLNASARGKPARVLSPYLGIEYSEDEIRSSLELNCSRVRFECPDAFLDHVAGAVADGMVVGWFQGRSEFGPRALGNRSILAHPGLEDIADRVNSKVKFREAFRPFAPTVLAEEADTFLVPMGNRSPYMSFAQPIAPEHLGELPSVTHVDGTARLQYLRDHENPLFHALIKRFMSIAGIPMILNTSFNVQGEPIVESPDDAIWTLLNSGMDALAIGPFWVTKIPFPSDTELETMRILAESDVLIESMCHPGGDIDSATVYVGGRAFKAEGLAPVVLECCQCPQSLASLAQELLGDQDDMREALVSAIRDLHGMGAIRMVSANTGGE